MHNQDGYIGTYIAVYIMYIAIYIMHRSVYIMYISTYMSRLCVYTGICVFVCVRARLCACVARCACVLLAVYACEFVRGGGVGGCVDGWLVCMCVCACTRVLCLTGWVLVGEGGRGGRRAVTVRGRLGHVARCPVWGLGSRSRSVVIVFRV